jgi:hypothetical protein
MKHPALLTNGEQLKEKLFSQNSCSCFLQKNQGDGSHMMERVLGHNIVNLSQIGHFGK